MPIEIEKHYVNTYKNTVQMLSQQMISKTESLVTVQQCNGNGAAVADQYGSVNARRKTERHEDTKYTETPRARRWLQPQEYYSAELVDQSDIIRLLTDPKSSLAQAHVAAMNRAKDSEFFTNIFAAAQVGELPTSGTAAYSTAGDVAADFEVPGTPSGLSPAKLIRAKELFMSRFVDVDAEPLTVVIPSRGWAGMFGQTSFTSSDFNTNKPLVSAPTAIPYAGMNLVTIDHVDFPRNGTTTWNCPVFAKSGVVMGIWQDIDVEVQKHPLKVSSYEVKVTGRWAVTRVEEAKVATVLIRHAA
jgi:hypothetical protein